MWTSGIFSGGPLCARCALNDMVFAREQKLGAINAQNLDRRPGGVEVDRSRASRWPLQSAITGATKA
jgi:hypothetical protein